MYIMYSLKKQYRRGRGKCGRGRGKSRRYDFGKAFWGRYFIKGSQKGMYGLMARKLKFEEGCWSGDGRCNNN